MAKENSNAPSYAHLPLPADFSPHGVTHVTVRHRSHFTVIGNHLAQHTDLSLTAIGLATHIQSLPPGTRVDIKTLTEKFDEGEVRIARALRELEAYGYLRRVRQRLASGHVVTRTVSYNNPGAYGSKAPGDDDPPVPPKPKAQPPVRTEPPTPPKPKPPLPTPTTDNPEHTASAKALLITLHLTDARLLLRRKDVTDLTPAVATWLERGVPLEKIRTTLTTALPTPLHHAPALLAHRLTDHLPPPLPPTAPRPHPVTTCEGCDRGIRAPKGTRCRDCRPTELQEAA
ncbi:helix-turn-helix domain-containing protein [Streptomyces niveiscabiei]|uniref:helix-turn-helix domain-containing protein n=1 Tax=Streptomyces niveiscabiei TaxID=164115 RepID=UPI0029AB174A|nr:helix-turn-helix domain-containing protein [Streptomyces niveiscabiei]MDX3383767.1 helix-turn-helix domain-containing protein [Streptomyces niveiscabiei]